MIIVAEAVSSANHAIASGTARSGRSEMTPSTPQVEQPVDVCGAVDHPHLDTGAIAVRLPDERRARPRGGGRRARDLKRRRTAVRADERPAAPRAIQRPARFRLRRAGRDLGRLGPNDVERRRWNEPTQTRSTAAPCAGRPSTTARASAGSPCFISMIIARAREPLAAPLRASARRSAAAKRELPSAAPKCDAGVDARQLRRVARAHRPVSRWSCDPASRRE